MIIRKMAAGSASHFETSFKPVCIIYAHLDRKILCKVGDKIKEGKVFAKVGKAL